MSAGFKSKKQQFFFMKELPSVKECEIKIKEFSSKSDNVLMIDGITLDFIFSSKTLEESFFSVATLAPSVCVCRCSPT
jgi:hypothetical protein